MLEDEMALLLRLARIVQALAANTPLHDQALDVVADLESEQRSLRHEYAEYAAAIGALANTSARSGARRE
jgi:predicted metal-dependent hydrolase